MLQCKILSPKMFFVRKSWIKLMVYHSIEIYKALFKDKRLIQSVCSKYNDKCDPEKEKVFLNSFGSYLFMLAENRHL